MLKRGVGDVKHAPAAFPLHRPPWQASLNKCKQQPTIPFRLAQHLTCSWVSAATCYTYQQHFHCSELFGKIPSPYVSNGQRSLRCLPNIRHVQIYRQNRNTCQQRFHCSELFGRTPSSNANNGQRSLWCLPSIWHVQTWRRRDTWSAACSLLSTLRLDSYKVHTTANDPFRACLAFGMLRRCGCDVKHVTAAFPLLRTHGKGNINKCEQRPTIPFRIAQHLTCSDVASAT